MRPILYPGHLLGRGRGHGPVLALPPGARERYRESERAGEREVESEGGGVRSILYSGHLPLGAPSRFRVQGPYQRYRYQLGRQDTRRTITPNRCRASVEHVRQSKLDSGLGFQVKFLESFQVVSSSLGIGQSQMTALSASRNSFNPFRLIPPRYEPDEV